MRPAPAPFLLPETDIAAALAQGRVRLAFQPVMQARAQAKTAFHESLLRLLLPCGRVVGPQAFLVGLRHDGLRRALDRRALALALAELAAHQGLRLSVNVDPASLVDAGWQADLAAGVAGDPALAARLILEVTERAPLPPYAAIAAALARWRAWGVSLALDDFGAGFTAFRHLRDWRFDIVKIDGGFSRAVHRDPDNQALMRALVGLARHFEALCVAEAVERASDAAWLAGCGVDALQGYHFAEPTLAPAWRCADPALVAG